MLYQERRDFIRKTLIGGLLSAIQLPLLAADDSPIAQELLKKRFSLPKSDADWAKVRKQFPLNDKPVYFNSAGLGPSPEVVVDTLCEWTKKLEELGDTGRKYTKSPHQTLADFFGVPQFSVAVTRNTTEGINIVARSLDLKPGDEVILTRHEHIGGSAAWVALHKEIGIQVKLVELDLSGKENFDRITQAVTDKTKVISFSHITCTTGLRLPAKEIAQFCRERGIYSCVDGAQSAGMIRVNLSEMNPDFYVSSGHKWLMGPKGSGLLYINPETIKNITPIFSGAYTDSEFDLANLEMKYIQKTTREEYGTRNAPQVLALESAVKFLNQFGIDEIEKRGLHLAEYLKKGLNEIPEIEVISPMDREYASAIVTFRIKGMPFHDAYLDLMKTYRCRLRVIFENDLEAIRASCAIYNTEKDLDFLLESLRTMVAVNAQKEG
ncbi:aminotransferase class V-fold PLP-dependent enzyme [bacterium SCSIO 12741]|nr:aminotransferase class V-fold PLP-dependent enzyme [bacterium SCSIO 12741]